MLSLNEFKLKAEKEEKDYYKSLLSEGKELPNGFLAEEAREEYLIETFSEVIWVETEIDLTETTEIEGGLLEVYDFVPGPSAEKFDIIVEVNAELVSVATLDGIKEAIGAVSYDILEDLDKLAEAENAKVVFNRAGGNIKKVKKCAPGTKLKGNKCVSQGGSEKAGNKRKGIQMKKAIRARGAADQKKAAIKAKITKKRVANKSRNYSGT